MVRSEIRGCQPGQGGQELVAGDWLSWRCPGAGVMRAGGGVEEALIHECEGSVQN